MPITSHGEADHSVRHGRLWLPGPLSSPLGGEGGGGIAGIDRRAVLGVDDEAAGTAVGGRVEAPGGGAETVLDMLGVPAPPDLDGCSLLRAG